MTRAFVIAAAVATACASTEISVALAGNAGESRTLGVTDRYTPITAYGSTIAWSQFDRVTGRYSLMIHRRGRLAKAPIRTRTSPFDADIGLDAQGREVVTYSRCALEPSYSLPASELHTVRAGRSCRLYAHRLGSSTERRLSRIGQPGTSEYLPSQWRSRVAFARVDRTGRVTLQVTDLAGRPVRSLKQRGDRPEALPTKIDMHGRRVSYGWRFELPACPGGMEDKTFVGSEIWLDDLGARTSRRIAHGCDASLTAGVASPTVLATRVTYLLRDRPAFDVASRYSVMTYDMRTRRRTSGPPTTGALVLQVARIDAGVVTLSESYSETQTRYVVGQAE